MELLQPEPIDRFSPDVVFIQEVAGDFLGRGLQAGQPTVAIATPSHVALIEQHLRAGGFDLEALKQLGIYRALDAQRMLDTFMAGPELEAARCTEALEAVVGRAVGGQAPRLYGEMVGLLVEQGRSEAAVRLEQVWAELKRRQPFSLLCAYPTTGLAGHELVDLVPLVSAERSDVLPAGGYARPSTPRVGLEHLSLLQQQAQTLALEIEAHKRSEDLLAAEKSVLEQIVRGLPATAVLDQLARLIESRCPGAACSILLASEDGRSLRHGVAPSLPASYCQAVDGLLIGPAAGSCGTAAYRRERVIVRDTATDPLWEGWRELALANGLRSCWSTPIRAANGEVLGTFALYHGEPNEPSEAELGLVDTLTYIAGIVLERRRAEQDRDAKKRHQEEFLAAAAHDLRTPLTTISGLAQLLQRQLGRVSGLASSGPEELAQILSATRKAVALMDELLDVSRIEADGSLDLRISATDLVAIARQVAANQQQSTDRHRITVEASAPALTGAWDAARLERAVDNLVSNAVKYSPDGGDVTLRLARANDEGRGWATLAVEDHGLGISPSDLERVFERFQRGLNVRDRIGGSGVGLTYSREIALRHGGTLTVQSEEGSGSTFSLRLPLPSA